MRKRPKNWLALVAGLTMFSMALQNCTAGRSQATSANQTTSTPGGSQVQMDVEVIFPAGEDNVLYTSGSQSILITISAESNFTRRDLNTSTWNIYRGLDTLTSCSELGVEGNENWEYIKTLSNILDEVTLDTSNWETGVYYLCFYSASLPLEFKTGALRISNPGEPLGPTGMTGELSGVNAVALTWVDNSDNEEGFIIERSVDQLEWIEIGVVEANGIVFNDYNIVPESTYFYRSKAWNDVGYSPPSAAFEFLVPQEGTSLASPINLTSTDKTYTTIRLEWQDVSNNNTGLRVERSLTGSAPWTAVTNLADGIETFEDSSLTQSTDYFYRIIATNNASESLPSSVLKVKTYGPPVALTSLNGSTLDQQIDLSWDSEFEVLIVKSNIGSTVTWTPTSGQTHNVGPLDANHTLIYRGTVGDFSDTGLTNGVIQYYAAFVDNGLKEYSTATKRAIRPNQILSFGLGNYSMCVNTSDENVYCWGFNGNGFVGDNNAPTNSRYAVPVDTAWMQDHDAGQTLTVEKKFSQIAVGGFAATVCATAPDGYAYCWGSNTGEQLGNQWHSAGGSGRVYMAVDNAGTPFNKVYGGGEVSCGTDTSNNGYCWGSNFGAMVGNNTLGAAKYDSAQTLSTASKFLDFTFGDESVCGLTTISTIECWGANYIGQLGRTAGANDPTPTTISLSKTWVQVSSGHSHSCAIDDLGDLYCWGSDYLGEIGDGDRDLDLDPADGTTETPTKPDTSGTDINSFKAVAAISWGTCALTDANKIYCWGREFLKPQASASIFYTPQELFTTGLPENFEVKKMQGNYYDNLGGNISGKLCLLLTTNELYCTGFGLYGQLGQGNTTDYLDRFVKINLISPP